MTLGRWSQFGDDSSLIGTIDRLFGDREGISAGYVAGAGESGLPTFRLPVDIVETENGYTIQAPVPGFRPEEVEVTLQEGVLSIEARRSEEEAGRPSGQYLRREVPFGNYRRLITLPGEVQADKISASFANGMLTLEVPRAPRPEPIRIQVEPGEPARMEGAKSKGG